MLIERGSLSRFKVLIDQIAEAPSEVVRYSSVTLVGNIELIDIPLCLAELTRLLTLMLSLHTYVYVESGYIRSRLEYTVEVEIDKMKKKSV